MMIKTSFQSVREKEQNKMVSRSKKLMGYLKPINTKEDGDLSKY